jgi:hypothetical protein
MITTYKARLHGNLLDWQEEPPPVSASDVSVLVTVLPNEEAASRPHVPSGRRLVDILKRLARENPVPSIPDPIVWQKETRQDRALPGREG